MKMFLTVLTVIAVSSISAFGASEDPNAALKKECFNLHRYLMSSYKAFAPITVESCWNRHGYMMQTDKKR